jgi:hypothetical protein
MPSRKRSIFVDPDVFTNTLIRRNLLSTEEHFHENKLAESGVPISVWEFDEADMPKLGELLANPDSHFDMYEEVGNGPIRRLRRISKSRV